MSVPVLWRWSPHAAARRKLDLTRRREPTAAQRADLRFNEGSIRTRSVAMSLLDQAHKLERQVMDRLRELEPHILEYEHLRRLAEQLGLKYTPKPAAADAGAQPSSTTRRRTTRAKAAKAKATRSSRGQTDKRAAKATGRRRARASGASSTTATSTARRSRSGGGRTRA